MVVTPAVGRVGWIRAAARPAAAAAPPRLCNPRLCCALLCAPSVQLCCTVPHGSAVCARPAWETSRLARESLEQVAGRSKSKSLLLLCCKNRCTAPHSAALEQAGERAGICVRVTRLPAHCAALRNTLPRARSRTAARTSYKCAREAACHSAWERLASAFNTMPASHSY